MAFAAELVEHWIWFYAFVATCMACMLLLACSNRALRKEVRRRRATKLTRLGRPLNVAIWIEHECGIVVRCVLLAQSRPSVVGLAESQPTFRLTPTAPSTLQCPTLLNCCHAGATV